MKVVLLTHTPLPEEIVAIAGKLCYSKVGIEELQEKQTPNDIERFTKMLVDLGHASPLEHVSFTFAVEGISRACSMQLVRHRIASYSQQSQRYVNLENNFEYITPDKIKENGDINKKYIEIMETIYEAYVEISKSLLETYVYEFLVEDTKLYCPDIIQDIPYMLKIMEHNHRKEYNAFIKKAIEDARYVLPNACETKLVFTMNARTLLNFFNKRDCNRAQDEIKNMARLMMDEVKKVAPSLFVKAGAGCRFGKCPEGKMSCGKPLK